MPPFRVGQADFVPRVIREHRHRDFSAPGRAVPLGARRTAVPHVARASRPGESWARCHGGRAEGPSHVPLCCIASPSYFLLPSPNSVSPQGRGIAIKIRSRLTGEPLRTTVGELRVEKGYLFLLKSVGKEFRSGFLAMINHVVELIRRTSTDISQDVVDSILKARRREKAGSMARTLFDQILRNIELARQKSVPVCQDTGTNIFYVDCPAGTPTAPIRAAITAAVRQATRKYYLRPNSVETLSGRNTGDNVGIGHPSIHFNQWGRKTIRFRLMLKGGGSENVGAQYTLPDGSLSAGRDLEGVEKCVLDAVFKAQGKGCAPGVIGVGIGGDRGSSYLLSKEQFFRGLDDKNPETALRKMEERLFRRLNSLGIGPMGLGGNATVLGVKIGVANRIPACYFVSVSYMCWAYRRRSMIWKGGKPLYDQD